MAAPLPYDLPTALRHASGRVADCSGGAVLLFGCGSGGGEPRLRAAAGVSSPDAARAAAASLSEPVRQALRDGIGVELAPIPSLGARGVAGTLIVPLRLGVRVLGVLAIGTPEPPDEAVLRGVEILADEISLRLDHSRLFEQQVGTERTAAAVVPVPGKDKEEELLRLSERLFAQDIELMRSQEKLGKVERLKNDFIEKMSRELRTPLNGIIEAIIAVLAGENDALSDSARQTLRCALDDGTAFLRTLQNILDLWRIKQNELPVEIQDVNFREVVEEAIFSVQDVLDAKPVTIEKRLHEPMPKIRTDLAKINQILFLLLENAVKFTLKGGITIEARLEDEHLVCEVADTGIGICPDDQQFVFDEFYQVDDPASTRYRGSGLGLALVRDLLELLDGEVSVSSEPGVGSSFHFRVPVQIVG